MIFLKNTPLFVIIFFTVNVAAYAQGGWPSFDFKSVSSEGDTLYYRITSQTEPYTVAVARCRDSVYHNLPAPEFAWQVGQPEFLYHVYDYDTLVTIPPEVFHEGVTYNVTSVDKEAFYMQKNYEQ